MNGAGGGLQDDHDVVVVLLKGDGKRREPVLNRHRFKTVINSVLVTIFRQTNAMVDIIRECNQIFLIHVNNDSYIDKIKTTFIGKIKASASEDNG